MAATNQWYWCFDHDRVEHEGDQCRANNRLGPYASEEAARNWQATTEARDAEWKRQDEAWEGDAPSD